MLEANQLEWFSGEQWRQRRDKAPGPTSATYVVIGHCYRWDLGHFCGGHLQARATTHECWIFKSYAKFTFGVDVYILSDVKQDSKVI